MQTSHSVTLNMLELAPPPRPPTPTRADRERLNLLRKAMLSPELNDSPAFLPIGG